MGLFSKKPKADVQPNPSESQQTAVNVKKNRKDTMASVLRESVLEVSLEELRNNKLFITERNGQKLYVGIRFKVADIGGLSKRTNKDEAKGSMVESINNGRIKVLITSDMMANEEVIIIPDVYTCDAMDEYSILTEAPYTAADAVAISSTFFLTNSSISLLSARTEPPREAVSGMMLQAVPEWI